MRNFFGRRRSGGSRSRRGGSSGRTGRGGFFGGSMEQALGALVLVVLALIMLRLLGLL
jgi:hypothetical protein